MKLLYILLILVLELQYVSLINSNLLVSINSLIIDPFFLSNLISLKISLFDFEISGDNKILNHILKNGLGSKRNSGFGLVEQAF